MIVSGRGRHGVGHPELTDGERRAADQIKRGTVHEADYANARVRVLIGDPDDDEGHLVTGWLPMPGGRSRNDSEWHPLEVGEGVIVLSESGELQNGVVVPAGFYSDENPAPGDKAGLWRKKFADGGLIEHDRDTGEWLVKGMAKVTLEVGGGTAVVTEDAITLTVGGVTLTVSAAGVSIDGGEVTHNGKNIGATHKHLNVSPGAGVSGMPQ